MCIIPMNKILCVILLLLLAFYFRESITALISVLTGTVHFIIDEHWFGIRNLTVELSREFNVRAEPEMDKMHSEINSRLRTAAVRAYRMHFGNMESVAERTMREQQIEMRRVSEALEQVAVCMYHNKSTMAFVLESRYNGDSVILPKTWSLVSSVVSSRKMFWLNTMERAADKVRKELRNKDTVVAEMFKETLPVKRSYNERAAEFAQDLFYVFAFVRTLAFFQ